MFMTTSKIAISNHLQTVCVLLIDLTPCLYSATKPKYSHTADLYLLPVGFSNFMSMLGWFVELSSILNTFLREIDRPLLIGSCTVRLTNQNAVCTVAVRGQTWMPTTTRPCFLSTFWLSYKCFEVDSLTLNNI